MNGKPLLLFLLVSLLLVVIAKAPITSTPFTVFVESGGGLGFQNEIGRYVEIEVTSGAINSSNSRLTMNVGGGNFRFNSSQNNTFRVTFNVTNCRVAGDSGSELRPVSSGNTIIAGQNELISVIWDFEMSPLLPLVFILGMVGLTGMIVSPVYAIHLLKKRKFEDAFIMGTILFSVCVGLFVAWLGA